MELRLEQDVQVGCSHQNSARSLPVCSTCEAGELKIQGICPVAKAKNLAKK